MSTIAVERNAVAPLREPVRDGLPPGPRLPAAVQTALLWRNTRFFLDNCRRRFGPTFTVRDLLMGTLVYLTDPDDIKAVFTGDPAVFHAGEANSILAPVLGERSVLVLDEDEHLEQRKRMLPAFHGESVRRYRETIASIVDDEISRWPLDREFPIHERMHAVALEVILRVVIGARDPERLADLRRVLQRVVDLDAVLLMMWLKPGLGRFGPWRRYNQLLAEADELLYDEIRKRREDPDIDRREDVLSMLIRVADERGTLASDQDLRDQLVTLLLAGHETTASSLAWAFERLSRNPVVLDRLVASLADDDDSYLDAVVKETLRTRPVIIDVVRKLKAPVELGGYRLPEGVTVLPAIMLVQEDGGRFPDPYRFEPERFLDGRDEGSAYGLIPFGGGRRRCVGAAFASLEMKTVLRTVLCRLRLNTTDAPPERERFKHITLVPAKGGRVSFRELPATSEP